MSRPIVLPVKPENDLIHDGLRYWDYGSMRAYARAAVEADRAAITVTDDDVKAAIDDEVRWLLKEEDAHDDEIMRAVLESFAKRLRGET